jgi:nitrite reductase (cytochrome c-552)
MIDADRKRRLGAYGLAALALVFAAAAVVLLLLNISQRKAEALVYPLKVVDIGAAELDPAVWGKNFPLEYDSFRRTEENYGRTEYGGSEPYSRLERYPVLKRLWAGYPFSVDYNEERGHFYALVDQKATLRVKNFKQPGACANCHAAEAPLLIAGMGWAAFNATPYKDLADKLHGGSTCADCHDPETMALVISRPAFKNAMAQAGADLDKASRQEMRSYVCAQCHVEYYFRGPEKELTFPWSRGRTVEAIEAHYDEYGHVDWVHPETGASMLKMQHPEFEVWGTGIHARSGVACADCHMPYVRAGSVKVSDHWLRSPLTDVRQACGACHPWPEDEMKGRVREIQDKTAGLLRAAEAALVSALDAVADVRKAGADDAALAEARALLRRGQMRWDLIFSENSTGFHSPQEAARVLAGAVDLARQAEIKARSIRLPG